MDIAVYLIGGAADEMKIVVVDEAGGDFDECDVAGEAAVVEPVGLEGGNAFGQAGRVYSDDDEVIAVVEQVGGVAVVGGEAALVLAGEFAVDPDEAAIVGRADVEEGALVRLLLVGEVALIPEWAFVERSKSRWVFQSPGTLRVGDLLKSYSVLSLCSLRK